MTRRTIPVPTSTIQTARTDKFRRAEEELHEKFVRNIEEVRAGRGVIKSPDELKAIAADP